MIYLREGIWKTREKIVFEPTYTYYNENFSHFTNTPFSSFVIAAVGIECDAISLDKCHCGLNNFSYVVA